MGGGSAHVTPTHVIHPLDAIVERLRPHGVDVTHAVGCNINRRLPELDLRLCGPVTIDYFVDPDELGEDGADPDRTTHHRHGPDQVGGRPRRSRRRQP